MGDSRSGWPWGRCRLVCRRAVSQQGWHCHCSSLCLNGACSCSFNTGSCSGKSWKPAVYCKINLGWERVLRSSAAINMTLPSLPLNQVPKCMFFLIAPKYFISVRNQSALSTDRDRGKVLCLLLFPCPVPACCPSKKLGCLVHHDIVLQRNPLQHPFVFLLKTFALVISDTPFFCVWEIGKVCTWRCLRVKGNSCLGQNMRPQHTVVS